MKDAEQVGPLRIYGVEIDPDMFAKYDGELTLAQWNLLLSQIDLVGSEILTSVIDLHLSSLSDQVLLPQEKQHYRQHLIRLNQAYLRLSLHLQTDLRRQSKPLLRQSLLSTTRERLSLLGSDVPLLALAAWILFAFVCLLSLILYWQNFL